MKNVFLLSLLAFTASLCAEGAEETDMIAAGCGAPVRACPPAPCPPKPCPPPPCIPKPIICKPAKPCRPICDPLCLSPAVSLCDTGIYAFLDVLLWKTDIGNSDWLLQVPEGNNPGFIQTQKQFKFQWGFRAGLGYTLQNGEWDTNFAYTWFRGKQNQNFTIDSGTVKAFLLHQDAGNFDTVTNNWSIMLNVLDWEIGSSFFINRNLILRPKVGLKAGLIKQKIQEDLTASGSTNRHFLMKSRFLGVGPFCGLNSCWILGGYGGSFCAVVGEFDASFMYGQTKHTFIRAAAADFTDPITTIGLNQKIPRPMLRSLLGLGWSSRLGPDTMNLTIKLGYEVQYWFRQNQILHRPAQEADATLTSTTSLRLSDDLAFHGFVLSFRFDF